MAISFPVTSLQMIASINYGLRLNIYLLLAMKLI